MAADTQHKPSALKQQNKRHKTGRHRSKSQAAADNKGKVSVKVISHKAKQQLSKQERRNKVQQIRKYKRDDVISKKRSHGGSDGPPLLVTIIPLCADIDVEAALTILRSCDETAAVKQTLSAICHIALPRFRQRLAFISPNRLDSHSLSDVVKVSDTLLFLLSPVEGIDVQGEEIMTYLFGQGLPASVLAVQGLKNVNSKRQAEIKKLLQKCVEKRFPRDKIYNLDTAQDGILLLRQLGEQKLSNLAMREHRAHVLAECVTWEDTADGHCTMNVTGYVRGQALSANQLVHVCGWGDYQIARIDSPSDPNPLNKLTSNRKKNQAHMETNEGAMMDVDVRVVSVPDPSRQESLQSEVIPDPMDGEQTWPTDEELAEAKASRKAITKRVPKGTSDYQASWIIEGDKEEESGEESDDDDEELPMTAESDEDNEDDDDDDDDDDDAMKDDDEKDDDEEEFETMTIPEPGSHGKYDSQMDLGEEEAMLHKYKEARTHAMFPDEVDTPQDVPARQRFQRYRGLQSFRTTPWDPKENLPTDYARIYQFANFKQTKKRVLMQETDEGAPTGLYVTIQVKNVPVMLKETLKPGDPLVLFGLLPHEQKMSVVHFILKRLADNGDIIKSKERMVFHVGYRRFAACPVYSQHTNANKHKAERFLRHEGATVATIYAPVIFPPASVLMFREKPDGSQSLVATGYVLTVDPDRIITKRIVLSGHPFKINVKSATVRYMFFNRDDINWFKPVELRTKYGRRGHIREPLGTHGHMKCVFDQQLKSQDTVLMTLYKRIFPKWTYEPYVKSPQTAQLSDDDAQRLKNLKEMFDD